LQYTASWSSCSSSLLLDGVISEESDEGIEIIAHQSIDKKAHVVQPKINTDNKLANVAISHQGAEKQSNGQNLHNKATISSPEKMHLLSAMRQVVLKQQDAIKELSDQNVQCKHLLLLCQDEMKTMKRENNAQRERVTQLVCEKEALQSEAVDLKKKVQSLQAELQMKHENKERQNSIAQLVRDNEALRSETSTLKQELISLKAELAEIRDEDDNLQKKFKSLLDDDAGFSSDDSLSLDEGRDDILSDKENSTKMDVNEWDELLNKSRDEAADIDESDSEWLKKIESSVTHTMKQEGYSKGAKTQEIRSATTSSNAQSATDEVVVSTSKETDAALTSKPSCGTTEERLTEQKKDNVAMFKQRLDVIQQKRRTRHTRPDKKTVSWKVS
jgi:chromosome segregation ATPase